MCAPVRSMRTGAHASTAIARIPETATSVEYDARAKTIQEVLEAFNKLHPASEAAFGSRRGPTSRAWPHEGSAELRARMLRRQFGERIGARRKVVQRSIR